MNFHEHPIRVGIRGIGGMLGRRLALDIEKNPDMQVVFGVGKKDATLPCLIGFVKAISEESRARISESLYLEEDREKVREVNAQTDANFKPLDQLPSLSRMCDIFVDATRRPPGAKNVFDDRYPSFDGAVLLQSGDYPRGRLISPPVIEAAGAEKAHEPHVYRQGDCILSGTVPVLAAIASIAKRIRLNVVMQVDEPLNTFPTHPNVVGMYPRPDKAAMVEKQLRTLFPAHGIEVDSVIQIPAHDTYTVTVHAQVPADTGHEDVREILSAVPRVRIAPKSIRSTADFDQAIREPAAMLGRQVSSINVYDAFVETKKRDGQNVVRIQLAVYSRLAAVLPNIDSIRMLAHNTPALEAMRATDENIGLQ